MQALYHSVKVKRELSQKVRQAVVLLAERKRTPQCPPEMLEEVVGEREGLASLLKLLPL